MNDGQMRRKKKEARAYHEAGHAVILHALEIRRILTDPAIEFRALTRGAAS